MFAEFHFVRPWWLLALLPLVLLWWRLRHTSAGAGAWQRICDAHLLPHLLVVNHSGGGLILGLLGAGWLAAVLALAGPAWSRQPQPVFQTVAGRVIVLDLSRSMLAPDLKPSRLVRARYKIADLLNRIEEGQTGLVAFAGEAFVVTPLTRDTATIAALLPALEPGIMPVPGSRTGRALSKAAELLKQAGHKQGEILLVADAGHPSALHTARTLRSQGFRTSVLAVGTARGAPIPVAGGGFLQDRAGDLVIPQLDTAALRDLAAAGGGRFARLGAQDSDLDWLLNHGPLQERAEDGERETTRWREEGPWLVALLLPLAALAFRRGWLVMLALVMVLPQPARALDWADLWQNREQRAHRALHEGDYERAARLSRDPLRRGVAEYRRGRYEQALEAFEQARGADAHYNRGNALVKLNRLEEALRAYDAALAADPDLEDARHNRRLVEQWLRRQKQRQSASSGQKRQQGEEGDGAGRGQGDTNSPKDGERRDSPSQANEGHSRDEAGDRSADAPASQRPEDEAEGTAARRAMAAEDSTTAEERQVMEQWLRRVPDDPGGLLRRKFRYQYQRDGPRRDAPIEETW